MHSMDELWNPLKQALQSSCCVTRTLPQPNPFLKISWERDVYRCAPISLPSSIHPYTFLL